MTEAHAITLMRTHLESLFPKTCPNCQHHFASLRDFFANARPVGTPISYDLEDGDVKPVRPVGAVALSNCLCGSTLALTSEGMPLLKLWSVLLWARGETRRRGLTNQELMQHLRVQMRLQVLAEPDLQPANETPEGKGMLPSMLVLNLV